MEEVKDVYNAIERYSNSKKKLVNDKSILPENRKLFIKWLDKKEDQLKRRKGRDRNALIRSCKTMSKYITLLKGIDRFFNKPLKTITKKDIERVYDDLEEGRITNSKGTKISESTRRDYYNKVMKSDFFDFIGKKEIAKRIIVLERSNDEEVRFFDKEDLDVMAKFTNRTVNKLFLYLLFDSSMRVATLLNIKYNDLDKRHNLETKQDYYLVHIKKAYTKSKRNRTTALLLNESNELLGIMLKDKSKEEMNDYIFNFSYASARKLIKRVATKAKVKAKPDGKAVKVKDFRSACATWLLGRGYSTDFVKKRLGHRPSSTVIDRYVNYLGLSEDKAVKQAQDMDYNKLRVAYKESIERLKVLDANQKMQMNKLERIEKALAILNDYKPPSDASV